MKHQTEKEQSRPAERKKDLVRDVNTVGEYYKAWDKFDVDKELTKLEEEEQRAYKPYNPYEDSRTNMRAKPKTKINVSGRRVVVSDPTDLKDKVALPPLRATSTSRVSSTTKPSTATPSASTNSRRRTSPLKR